MTTIVRQHQPEGQPEIQQHDREEPTTVEAPTWDDEPAVTVDHATGPETWPLTPELPATSAVAKVREVEEEPVPEAVVTEMKPEVETRSPAQVAQPISALPEQVSAISLPKLTSCPAHLHIAAARVTTGVERVGMQFGSLDLGGDYTNVEPSSYVTVRRKCAIIYQRY